MQIQDRVVTQRLAVTKPFASSRNYLTSYKMPNYLQQTIMEDISRAKLSSSFATEHCSNITKIEDAKIVVQSDFAIVDAEIDVDIRQEGFEVGWSIFSEILACKDKKAMTTEVGHSKVRTVCLRALPWSTDALQKAAIYVSI